MTEWLHSEKNYLALKNMCDKKGYASQREANRVLNMARKPHGSNHARRLNKRKDKRPIRACMCPDCSLWHLTSARNKEGI